MMKVSILTIMVLIGLVFASTGSAVWRVEISTDLVDKKWASPRVIDVVFAVDTDGYRIVVADSDVPDHRAVLKKDTQTWHAETGSGGWWKFTFSATAVGILQGRSDSEYALRYGHILLSDWSAVFITKPKPGKSS